MRELVVLSHLRWTFVWQRPQQLVSRLACEWRTWFVEEPVAGDVAEPTLRTEPRGPVMRVWLEVPGEPRHVDFGDPAVAVYADALAECLGPGHGRIAWLYTPMALDVARRLEPELLVYDVMDDLAAFKGAPAALSFVQAQALRSADVVFAGGRSLHRSVAARRPDTHLFPSGVDRAHYAVPRASREPGARPVAGYVGVIDERIDLELVAGLAAALADWEIRMVGPAAKIDPGDLPHADNIRYDGPQPYERLPAVMSAFDVALMPFALNEATRSISPTKTLEYLAAGLPVVSTPVPDVVADYGAIVAVASDADGFARACRFAGRGAGDQRQAAVARLLQTHSWDGIAARMKLTIEEAAARQPASIA